MIPTIRPDTNHGGSSKIVKDICTGLAAKGHTVTLLCARTTDNFEVFDLTDNVHVRPELPFRQSWSDTWLVPPADLTKIITTVASHAARADRVFIFDSHFLYSDVVPADTPLIWSLRDFVYVQALQGSMTFRRDMLIANSRYTRDSFCDATVGWLPGIEERAITIPNGVDLDRYAPRDPANMRARLGIGEEPALLFPHRPEEAKGFGTSLELVRRLTGTHPNIKLVITRGTDAAIIPEVRAFYEELDERAERLGVADNLVFVDWLGPGEMPDLYSAVNATLCLGNLVEAFGNTVLESLACGTPVIASDIANYRELNVALHKVPVGDLDAIEKTALQLCDTSVEFDVESARNGLRQEHGYADMVNSYCQVIETATVKQPLVPELVDPGRVKVPTWISMQGSALYDEYTKAKLDNQALEDIWATYGRAPFDAATSEFANVVDELRDAGLLVTASA